MNKIKTIDGGWMHSTLTILTREGRERSGCRERRLAALAKLKAAEGGQLA